jgi:hypothetical protein
VGLREGLGARARGREEGGRVGRGNDKFQDVAGRRSLLVEGAGAPWGVRVIEGGGSGVWGWLLLLRRHRW